MTPDTFQTVAVGWISALTFIAGTLLKIVLSHKTDIASAVQAVNELRGVVIAHGSNLAVQQSDITAIALATPAPVVSPSVITADTSSSPAIPPIKL